MDTHSSLLRFLKLTKLSRSAVAFGLLAVFFLPQLGFAQHKGLSFQAVLKKPDGTYPTVSGLSVTLQILDPVSNCVLREEIHSGVNISDGYINLVLGSGSATTPVGRNPAVVLSIPQVMDNSTPRSGLNCVDMNDNITASGHTYSPSATDARKLRLRAVVSGDTVVADFNMRAVAFAVNAENLNGKDASGFVQTSTEITQANVQSVYARYSVLDAILNGTYAGNAATATALAAAPGACPAGQYISGMTASGTITCSAPAGSVTNVSSANLYLTVATGTSTPVLTVNVGAVANTVAAGDDARFTDARAPTGAAGGDLSGTYPNPSVAKIAGKDVVLTTPANGEYLKYDGTNFVNATISTADATKLPLAGGQMAGAIDMNSQNLTNAGFITMSASKNLHLSNNAADPAGLVAADKGKVWFNSTSGQVKYWDGTTAIPLGAAGAGMQSLGGQTGTAQTFAIGTSGLAPAWNSATDTHTLNIPMASAAGVTAGLLNKTDYDAFSAKLGTASSFAGDVTGTSAAMSVDKIKGKAVTPGAYAAGQVLRYDGTDWVNAVLGFADLGAKPTTLAGYGITDAQSSTLASGKILVGNVGNIATAVNMSGDATMDNAGAVTLNTVPISKGGTGLTSFAVDKLVTTSGAGAIQTSSCGLNQVITFTAGGAIACANVSSLSASYINDGNSFAGAATLGTNDANSLTFETNNANRMTILSTGEIGIGNANPATALDVTGAVSQRGMAAPTLSPAGQGKIYFDSTSGKFRVSQDGGAYVDMIAATNGTVTNITAGMGLNVGAGPGGNITSTGTLNIDVGTGASQIVQLTAAAKYPAVDGSLITNLNPAALSSALPIANGGTGQTTKTGAYDALSPNTAKGDIAVFNGTNNVRVPAGANDQVLIADSTQAAGVKWSALPAAPGDASYLLKGLVQFDTDAATSGVSVTAGVASLNTGTTANKIVKLDGTAKLPAVDGSALTNVVATSYSGTLPVANGGTNSNTALNNDRMMVSAGGKIVEAVALTNGQVMLGSTGAAPVAASITGSSGAVVTPGAGTLAISTNAVAINTASTIVTRDASGNFAAGAITNNSNVLKGATSGALTMTVPAVVTPYTLTWPDAVGGAGAFLTTDASGNLSWGSPAAISDATYGAKGAVQFLTDAATSGITVASGVANVNTGVGANQIVKLDGTSKLPAVDGSALINLNASNVSSGTLPIARGGTNSSTALANGKVMISSAGAIIEGNASNTAKSNNTFVMRDGSGNIAGALGTFDQLAVNGAVSGTLNIYAPSAFTNWNLTLPVDDGTAGQVLSTNGSGVTSWISAATGSVTNITAGTGLNVGAGPGGSITSTGTLNIDVGTGASQIVQLTAASKYPAVDGSLITNLDPTALSAAVPISKGGTGETAKTAAYDALSPNTTKGDLAVHNGTDNVRVPAGTNNYVLTADSAQAAGLKWVALPSAPGDSSYILKGLVQFDTDAATSGVSVTAGVASLNTGTTANKIVKLDGTAKLPAVDGSALTNVVATSYSGTLPVANGGTNSNTALNNDRMMVSSAGKIVEAAALTNGQVMLGSTGAAPVAASITVSGGAVVTPGAGTLAISTNAVATNTPSTLVSRDASGNFAAGAITNNSNVLKGATSGALTMIVPATVTPYTLTWPNAVGGAGAFLTTDASGNLSWGSPAAISDASYAAKGAVQFLTDAATSGLTVASGVANVNSGTGANQIVKLDGTAKLPAVDGSALTNLNAGNIATGTLPIARGGTNSAAALTNGKVMVSSAGAIIEGVASTTAKTASTFVMRDGSGNIAGALGTFDQLAVNGSVSGAVNIYAPSTFTSWNLTLPSDDGTAGQVLSTNGSGVTSWISAGGVSGSGTTGKLPKFTAASTVGDSIITESSDKIGIGTATPTATLHIAGTSAAGALPNILTIEGAASTDANGSQAVSISAGQASAGRPTAMLTMQGSDYNGGNVVLQAGQGGNNGGVGTVGIYGGKGWNNPGANVYIAGGDHQWSTSFGDVILGMTSTGAARGKVGIGTTTPTEKLDVVGNVRIQGQAYSPSQISTAISPLTYNANLGNVMAWDTFAQTNVTVNIHNMKDGGSYTLSLRGTATGSTTVNCFSDAGSTALTSSFMPANSDRVANATVFSIIRVGPYCYISWSTGWQ